MEQSYTKINPTGNYAEELFKMRPVAGDAPLLHAVEKSFNSQKKYQQNKEAKKDSIIMQDFFGALNY